MNDWPHLEIDGVTSLAQAKSLALVPTDGVTIVVNMDPAWGPEPLARVSLRSDGLIVGAVAFRPFGPERELTEIIGKRWRLTWQDANHDGALDWDDD